MKNGITSLSVHEMINKHLKKPVPSRFFCRGCPSVPLSPFLCQMLLMPQQNKMQGICNTSPTSWLPGQTWVLSQSYEYLSACCVASAQTHATYQREQHKQWMGPLQMPFDKGSDSMFLYFGFCNNGLQGSSWKSVQDVQPILKFFVEGLGLY